MVHLWGADVLAGFLLRPLTGRGGLLGTQTGEADQSQLLAVHLQQEGPLFNVLVL